MPPIEEVLAENAQLKGRLAELEAQIAWFRRQVFARGKSEKVDMDQLGFAWSKSSPPTIFSRT